MYRIYAICCLLILPGLLGVFAQDQPADTTHLEEVSISVLPFRESYFEAGGSVFRLSPEESDRDMALVSSSLINTAPGVHMASGSLNTNRLVIRGVGSRTPYNSNRIRAYLDDIPLTSGDGISTLEDQDPLAIGSVEILKGPSSALYGSGLGGVIRLNSPYPALRGWSGSLLAETASFGSRRFGLSASYKKGSLAVHGGLSRSRQTGFRENGEYLRNSAFLHARYFAEKHQLSFTFSLTDLEAGISSSLNEEDFLSKPENAGGSWGSTGGFEAYVKALAGISLESEVTTRLKNKLIVHAAVADPYERRPFNILDQASRGFGIRDHVEYQLESLSLGSGLEFFHESFSWQTYETLAEGQGDLLADYDERRSYFNAFLFAQWRPARILLIDAGLNLNLLSYRILGEGSYSYNPVLSPRLGLSLLHGRHIRSYASAGHGFSAPSLEETLLPEGVVNTELKPESGWNIDLGNRGDFLSGRIRYDLSLYAIFLNDLLVTERLAEDVFTGVNAGSAWNRGMELALLASLKPDNTQGDFNLRLHLSCQLSRNTFSDFVDDEVDYSGRNLPGIPQKMLRAELIGEYRGFRLEFRHIYTGKQWMDDANSLEYTDYHLDNLQLGYRFEPGDSPFQIRLYGGIRNAFDTRYASMILINAPSFGGQAPRYYYPGDPRHFYLGLRFSIKQNSVN